MRCAVTGITTREFLVAAHIVPWSMDASIRLDPSNGICLSLIIDRAFEKGYLIIQDDYSIGVDLARVGTDEALRGSLQLYHGRTLSIPAQSPPKPSYLRRRREMFTLNDVQTQGQQAIRDSNNVAK
jgi:predicted restriction endonuclease